MTAGAETAEDASTASDVPADGQLVTVRNRVWVASDVVKGTLAAGDSSAMTARVPHVVTLISIEDDARDEELRVVWELERGAIAHDQHNLPDPAEGFDDPRQLDAFLDAVRWGGDRVGGQDRAAGALPFRHQDRGLPARSGGAGAVHAPHEPADRRRRRPRQDDRGRPGHAGADAAAQGQDHADRLPGRADPAVARRDARQVRPGVPHRRCGVPA